MKKLIYLTTALVLLACFASVHADAYDYEYTYATNYVSFDENGKAVGIMNMHLETLLASEVDEVTLRIPYENVNIWYVKERTEEQTVILYVYKDYSYDWESGNQTFTGIEYYTYTDYDYHQYTIDVDTTVRGGSTYITIPLRAPFMDEEVTETLVEAKTEEAEDAAQEKIEELEESGEESEEYEFPAFEKGTYLSIKYTVQDAIDVAEVEGTLEYKTITDVDAPIEVLTIGVSAPYGYEFTGTPEFPVAAPTEVRGEEIGWGGFTNQLSVSSGIATTSIAQSYAGESAEELQKMAMFTNGGGAYTTIEDMPAPTSYEYSERIDYVEVRSNIDADELITVEGEYRKTNIEPTFWEENQLYFLYIVGFLVLIGLIAGLQKRYKLFWG